MSVTRQTFTRGAGDRGIALIMTLMVMALMSALMIGFSAVVASDQRYRYVDRDRVRAFYAAQAGLERLSADLSNLFFANVAPSDAELASLGDTPPDMENVEFTTESDESVAYGVTYIPPDTGTTEWGNIATGPYQGLMASKKRYWLDSSVRTTPGGEAHLRRKVETVAIPVFQFGIFSSVDLSFSAADDFDFRGRVHTNGNLFLAQGGDTASTLWLRDRVTAVGEIVRQRLSNGASIDTSGSIRTVRVATAPGTFRNLARTEGSVVDGIPSAASKPWPTISLSTYNGYLRTGITGARRLNLPLLTTGGANIDVIRRPAPHEDQTNEQLLKERFFTKVSLRIMLGDRANELLALPGVTDTPPVSLDGDWTDAAQRPAGYGPMDAAHPPLARTVATWNATVAAVNTAGTVAAGTSRTVTMTAAAPTAGTIPAYFTPFIVGQQQLRITHNAGATINVNCSGKTLTTFIGCGAPQALVLPATISITLDGVTVSARVNSWQNVAGVSTISLINPDNTEAFSPSSFWAINSAAASGANVFVRCEGFDTAANPDVFTRCDVPAAIVAGSSMSIGALTNAMTTIGGFIKIELQDGEKKWRDVTTEILNWGFGGPNVAGRPCADPTPNAIIRLQRLKDNAEPGTTACSYQGTFRPSFYWPNTLFDSREALYRDSAANLNHPRLGGVMHYVALDVANLSRWLRGDAPYQSGSGNLALSVNGYSVYFSDRRNNRNQNSLETGEYGFEDVVNPTNAAGTPNSSLNTGEDMNGNGALETYGQFPSYNGTYNTTLPGAQDNLQLNNARPLAELRQPYAQVNRAVLFRRALKLINGEIRNGVNNIIAPGLTVASENPVYIEGDWNADSTRTSAAGLPAGGFVTPTRATSVLADAVTLLSNNWNDTRSFTSPYTTAGRLRTATAYRLAIIAGKGPIFPRPTNGEGATFGTDGGVHSFLRFLEGGGDATRAVSYLGSMATFYYHRQAISPFKCCGQIVYDVPVRNYSFDINFLDPALLPPLTPVFRDVNSLGFTQEIRPGL